MSVYNQLHNAVKSAVDDNNLEQLKYLVSIDADMTIDKNYAIRTAASNGNLEIVKYLVLSVGVDFDDFDNASNSAIDEASANGHLDVVKYLVSIGAYFNRSWCHSLLLAVTNGHFDVVKYFISIGASRKYLAGYASKWLPMLKYLVSVGIDVTEGDNHAILLAHLSHRYDVVKYLLSVGAYHDDLGLSVNKFIFELFYEGYYDVVLKLVDKCQTDTHNEKNIKLLKILVTKIINNKIINKLHNNMSYTDVIIKCAD